MAVKKSFVSSIIGKLLVAFLVGLVTLILIRIASDYVFEQLSTDIDKLSQPNERLILLNTLFRDISQLNQLQREETLKGQRRPSVTFMKENKRTSNTLDTLKVMLSDDSVQVARIREIEALLEKRERLFLEFLELSFLSYKDPQILKVLEEMLSDSARVDTSASDIKVVTTQDKKIVTTIEVDTIAGEKSNFFRRLFGKDKKEIQDNIVKKETKIREELLTTTDTIPVTSEDRILLETVRSTLDSIAQTRARQQREIQLRELEIVNANSVLVRQTLEVIKDVEDAELLNMQRQVAGSLGLASESVDKLNLIAIIFIVISAILLALTVVDITKSHNYRKELEKAKIIAEEFSEARQRFLSNMSHEIRTPLQSIVGYAEQARIRQYADENDINAIYYSSEHLLHIVNEILDYSKINSDQFTFDIKPFELVDLLKEVIAIMQPQAYKKSIGLVLDFDTSEPLFLEGDPMRLKQVLFNLLGNGIKFTEKGEVKLSVKTDEKEGQVIHARFKVIDSGIGIPEDKLGSIFEKFTQSGQDISEKFGGTGLGLTIAKALVENQGGAMQVSSKLGEGSVFSFHLPLKRAGEKQIEHMKENIDIGSLSGVVWLADDDPLILKLSSTILQKKGILHRCFKSAVELWEAYQREEPEVKIFFLDMRMPGMSGMELCEKLRASTDNDPSVKIFALTAQVLPDEREQLFNKGFDALLMKPFRESDLLNVLKETEHSAGQSIPTNHFTDEFEFDIEKVNAMTFGDKEQTLEILEIIIEESGKDLERMDALLNNEEWKELTLLIHRMAGRISQIGGKSLSGKYRALEMEIEETGTGQKSGEKIRKALAEGKNYIETLGKIVKKLSQGEMI